MTVTEKVAYLKGLAEGLDLGEGKEAGKGYSSKRRSAVCPHYVNNYLIYGLFFEYIKKLFEVLGELRFEGHSLFCSRMSERESLGVECLAESSFA